jgi:Uma2 family endonuclease
MTQPEFHRRYAAYSGDAKFELIGGIVYMASPLRWPHGTYHSELSFALGLYKAATPGIEAGDNATTILSDESEPQPDLALRILPECGGQSRLNEDEYVEGAPELIAEIAYSSRAIDLHQKRIDYEQAGVQEYLVVCVEEQELRWFDFASGRLLTPNRHGIHCCVIFPGLWVDSAALLARDSSRLAKVV